MAHFIEGAILGVILTAATLFYLIRHDKLDAKKAADELAALANKVKSK